VEERALFEQTKLHIERQPIRDSRYLESAYVVASYRGEVMYYNDIEGGFNTSHVDDREAIAECWCNQDSLQGALYRWLHPELYMGN
jgi:hypothetical protein